VIFTSILVHPSSDKEKRTMAETITTTQAEPEYPTEQSETLNGATRWQRIALGVIMLISVFMNFYKLGQVGFTSYYPPAIRSMLDSWHNFFFAAYDPGGFTALDKPPAGFWLQVLSAKIFGFTPISVLLPQAISGVLAVLLLYFLVRRQFGVTAGLLAALALALSPISIVTNRNITIDSTLALVLLIGAWAILRAASTGKLRWLLLCAAMIGIGFNIKMMEAYLVLPAFGLLYLLAAPISIWKRLWHLGLALVLLLVISFSWAVAVDLTPAAQRPHVGATTNDSEVGLSLGYNGLQRLLGVSSPLGPDSQSNNPAVTATPLASQGTPTSTNQEDTPAVAGPSEAPVITNGGPGPLEGPVMSSGGPGPAPVPQGPIAEFFSTLSRLFTEPLGSQNGWLLPLALFGIIALLKFRRPRPQSDRSLQGLILWGVWLLTMGIFFSVAKFFHEYYLTVMAPAIAALCGIGLVTMWKSYRGSGWRIWLLPLAIIVTGAVQISILANYPDWSRWTIPLITVLCLLSVGILISAKVAERFTHKALWPRLLVPALVPGLIVLLLSPTLWATITIFRGTEVNLPLAGPTQAHFNGNGPSQVDPALIRYLEANQGNAQILVAVSGVNSDQIILATNKQVMPLDGFSSYPLTTSQLASLIAQQKLRFLLINQPQAPPAAQSQAAVGQVNGASAPVGSAMWLPGQRSTVKSCQQVSGKHPRPAPMMRRSCTIVLLPIEVTLSILASSQLQMKLRLLPFVCIVICLAASLNNQQGGIQRARAYCPTFDIIVCSN
jgi:4-amino-4-deoxy-L-arabinose transferase-like glycosyltransferase